MDGRIIKNILHIKIGYFNSYKTINMISNLMVIGLIITTSIFILYFKNIAMLFIVLYLMILTVQENKRFNLVKRVYGLIRS